jgi:Domain of unknown function (DUF4258)
MVSERLIPANPLNFIQRCVRQARVFWTYHVNMRMQGRFISRQAVLDSVENYDIIDEYPRDKYFASYLIRSRYQERVFQVLFAVDVEEDNVRVTPIIQAWMNGKRI